MDNKMKGGFRVSEEDRKNKSDINENVLRI